VVQSAPIQLPLPPSPSLYQPAPELVEIRDRQPVARVNMPDGRPAWLATGYAEVRQVLVDPRFSRAAAAAPEAARTALSMAVNGSILGMDPPEHTRLRKLVARAFTARRVEQLRPYVVALVDELLTAATAEPRPVDLVAHFSLPLPVRVICGLLGVPTEDQHLFRAWSDAALMDAEVVPERVQAALAALAGYFTEQIAAREMTW
jgi:cytochrome P450